MITDCANCGEGKRNTQVSGEAGAPLPLGWPLGGGDKREWDLKDEIEPGCPDHGKEHSCKCKGPGAELAHLA